MNWGTTRQFLAALVLGMSAACMLSDKPTPPLTGPSELALSLTLTANPDVLSLDGASQSLVGIEAFDENGQPKANVAMRAEISVDGVLVDYGTLSARTLVTGSNGRATLTYTAPSPVQGGSSPSRVTLRITPSGTNAASAIARLLDIRLVPSGTVIGGGPTPNFVFTPAAPAAFSNVQFTSTSQPSLSSPIASYRWDFGDGDTATGPTASHAYAAGNYSATLTVTDTNGVSASISKTIQVSAGTVPIADFTFSPSAPGISQEISFNGGLSRAGTGHSIVRYDWNFGSGAPASGIVVSKSYDTAGTYSVVLTVTDDVGQTATKATSVTVSGGAGSQPTATFTFSPSSPGVGEQVFFNASTSSAGTGHSIASYAWTFGDGTTGTGVTTSHAYTASGTYGVQLTVTDETGQSTTSASTTISVGAPPAPTASFTFSPVLPGRFDEVVFDASSSTTAQGQTIVDVAWNFGDGTAVVHCPGGAPADCPGPTNRISTHTYQTATTFAVNLVVTDSAGRTGSTSRNVIIALAEPTVRITASPGSPLAGQSVNFNSDGTTYFSGSLPPSFPVSFAWSFGDGGTSTLRNPSHAYSAIGTYTAILSVTDNKGRTGVGSVTVTVVAPTPPAPPIAAFTPTAATRSLMVNSPVNFNAATSTSPSGALITNYSWDFGDGFTSPINAAPTTSHTYLTQGTNSVTLVVTTGSNGLTGTATGTVTVGP